MDNLLNELKENSTILCNSLSDTDVYKFLHTVQAPPKSQPPNFFNFSNLRNYTESPKKLTEQTSSSADPFKAPSDVLRCWSTNHDEQPLRQRTPEKQQLQFYNDFSSKKGSNTKTKSERKTSFSQTDFFANCLGIFESQASSDPNCCSSEYYYNYSDQRAEDFLSQVLSSRDNDMETDDIYSGKAFRGSSFGLLPKKQAITDVLKLSTTTIDFGTQLPGRILEESFEITNSSNKNLSIEVFVTCFNPELQHTEEYVYSIRSNYGYDYSETRQFVAGPNSVTSFKVAIKIPKIRLSDQIKGNIRIVAHELEGELTVNLKTESVFPKIFCPKQLYSNVMKRNFINVAISKQKSQEKKITLKNDSNVPVTLELGFYNSHPEQPSHECSVYPKSLTIPANGTAAATVLFKPSAAVVGLGNNKKSVASQKVLYGKAKDSSLVYSFVLWIETY